MSDILMPALSPTMEEGGLAKWHVKPGDKVEPGQVIAEIETDKATMEVEAVDDGEISEILVPEGTQGVKVNTPIARMKGDAGGPAPAPKSEAAKPEAPKALAAPPPKPAAPQPAPRLRPRRRRRTAASACSRLRWRVASPSRAASI